MDPHQQPNYNDTIATNGFRHIIKAASDALDHPDLAINMVDLIESHLEQIKESFFGTGDHKLHQDQGLYDRSLLVPEHFQEENDDLYYEEDQSHNQSQENQQVPATLSSRKHDEVASMFPEEFLAVLENGHREWFVLTANVHNFLFPNEPTGHRMFHKFLRSLEIYKLDKTGIEWVHLFFEDYVQPNYSKAPNASVIRMIDFDKLVFGDISIFAKKDLVHEANDLKNYRQAQIDLYAEKLAEDRLENARNSQLEAPLQRDDQKKIRIRSILNTHRWWRTQGKRSLLEKKLFGESSK